MEGTPIPSNEVLIHIDPETGYLKAYRMPRFAIGLSVDEVARSMRRLSNLFADCREELLKQTAELYETGKTAQG